MTDRPPNVVPTDVVSAADYERHARERLSADVWAYVAGAGADGATRRWNREAFDSLKLAGRVLADEGVNILMISTSTIRVSVVCNAGDMERAARALHTAFGLDSGADYDAPLPERR